MRILFLLAFTLATLACKHPAATTSTPNLPGVNTLHTPDWAKNASIYEVNIRQFSREGTFNAFAKDLPRIRNLGVDVLWIMPIYPISEQNRKCHDDAKTPCYGSYYAPFDYEAVNPEFGTLADFKQMINSAHALGLKVILDFVPNHTGWDSKWMREHPDYYKKGPDGKITDPINPDGTKWGWTDVAQLDYDNPKLREAWMKAHEYWMKNTNIDGFREDVAGAVPTDYWVQLRPRLEKIRPVFMLSENEDKAKEQYDAAFEMNYGWTLHSTLKDVASGKKPATAVYEWTEEYKKRYGTRGWQMNFTQNHDENSWNGTERESFGDGGTCFTALCFTIEGMGLIYNGQEASLNKRLLFFNKDQIDWTGKSRADFFKKLTTLKHENHALWNGKNGGPIQKIETSDDAKVYAFTREKDDDKVLCIFNLSKQPAGITWESTATDGKWRNVMDDNTTFVTLKKGERKTLQPYEYLIYSNK